MTTTLAYVFIGDKKQTLDEWKHKLGTTNEQLEILLLKYPDMDRDNLKYVVEVHTKFVHIYHVKFKIII